MSENNSVSLKRHYKNTRGEGDENISTPNEEGSNNDNVDAKIPRLESLKNETDTSEDSKDKLREDAEEEQPSGNDDVTERAEIGNLVADIRPPILQPSQFPEGIRSYTTDGLNNLLRNPNNPFARCVLHKLSNETYTENGNCIYDRSFGQLRKFISFQNGLTNTGRAVLQMKFNDQTLIEVEGTRKPSKRYAIEMFLRTLHDNCLVIEEETAPPCILVVYRNGAFSYVDPDTGFKFETSLVLSEPPRHSAPVTKSVGLAMMKKMGWNEGGGLGRNAQGMAEPLQATPVAKRVGFGNPTQTPLRVATTNLLTYFANTDTMDTDLLLPTFSIEERVLIHNIATKLNLKNKSNNVKQMVISKKLPINLHQFALDLRNGIRTSSRFRVIN